MKQGHKLILVPLFCILSASCPWIGSEADITIVAPEVPQSWNSWGDRLEYTLSSTDEKGTRILATLTNNEKNLELSLPKTDLSVLLLYPPAGFMPAGAFYPHDIEGRGVLALRYERGFIAETISLCLRKGIPASHINIERLAREIDTVSEGDHWCIDQGLIIEKLTYGIMSSYAVKKLPLYTVSIPLAARTWFLGNPFRMPVSSVDGVLTLERISPGLHTLFEAGGTGSVSFYVGDGGTISY